MLAFMLALGLATSQDTRTTTAVEDSLLQDFYGDEQTASCRAYLTANGARVATYQWWILGFISGARAAQATTARPVPRAEVGRLLIQAEEYCRARPSESLGQAARALLNPHVRP